MAFAKHIKWGKNISPGYFPLDVLDFDVALRLVVVKQALKLVVFRKVPANGRGKINVGRVGTRVDVLAKTLVTLVLPFLVEQVAAHQHACGVVVAQARSERTPDVGSQHRKQDSNPDPPIGATQDKREPHTPQPIFVRTLQVR